MIMFEMFTKKMPFIPNRESSRGLRGSLPEWVDRKIKAVCFQMMEVDIDKRPTCEQALVALKKL